MGWWDARLIEARYAGEYKVHVRYENALEADVDLSDLLEHPFYAPLKDKKRFAQVSVDSETPVLVWPDDIDIAPELIYQRACEAANYKDNP